MASLARNPRDILLDADAEYQRLAEQHAQYESELQKITTDPYLSSEALVEEVNLKKMKLHCKDEMERIAARVHRVAPPDLRKFAPSMTPSSPALRRCRVWCAPRPRKCESRDQSACARVRTRV